MSILRLRSTTTRVCLSSPPTRMSVAAENDSPEAVPRAPLSAAMPGAPSNVQASVQAMAVGRGFTNPDPLGPFFTHLGPLWFTELERGAISFAGVGGRTRPTLP